MAFAEHETVAQRVGGRTRIDPEDVEVKAGQDVQARQARPEMGQTGMVGVRHRLGPQSRANRSGCRRQCVGGAGVSIPPILCLVDVVERLGFEDFHVSFTQAIQRSRPSQADAIAPAQFAADLPLSTCRRHPCKTLADHLDTVLERCVHLAQMRRTRSRMVTLWSVGCDSTRRRGRHHHTAMSPRPRPDVDERPLGWPPPCSISFRSSSTNRMVRERMR